MRRALRAGRLPFTFGGGTYNDIQNSLVPDASTNAVAGACAPRRWRSSWKQQRYWSRGQHQIAVGQGDLTAQARPWSRWFFQHLHQNGLLLAEHLVDLAGLMISGSILKLSSTWVLILPDMELLVNLSSERSFGTGPYSEERHLFVPNVDKSSIQPASIA